MLETQEQTKKEMKFWKIKTMRREMGLTQMEMASICKTSQTKWSNMESRKNPDLADEVYSTVRTMFENWREDEIFRLQEEIERLKKL